jgi:excinuclease ABC subunit A
VPCDVCHGKRYNRETLEILYKGFSIHDVLDMTVEDALKLFEPVPTIARKLETLLDVGLSYVKLGQPATTLSGGEAQRVKLSKELSRRDTGRTLYILDEPTTGLHFHDIEHLLAVLHKLRNDGNTIVVIEHNLDVIKTADWVIDLGPEGGHRGGQIIAQGTPEDIARMPQSWTGQFLAKTLVAHAKPSKRKSAA